MFQNSISLEEKSIEHINTIENGMVGLQVIDVKPLMLPIESYTVEFEVSDSKPFNIVEEFILKVASDSVLSAKISRSMLGNMMKLDDIIINSTVTELVRLQVFKETYKGLLKITAKGKKYFEKGMIPTSPKVHQIKFHYDPTFGIFMDTVTEFKILSDEYSHPEYLEKLNVPLDGQVNSKLIVDLGKKQGASYENSSIGRQITTIREPQLYNKGFIYLTQLWIHDIVEDNLFPRVINNHTGAVRDDIELFLIENEHFPEFKNTEMANLDSPSKDPIYMAYHSEVRKDLKNQRKLKKVADSRNIRLLRGSQIRAEFLNALKDTKKRVLVISPWMTEEAVDDKLISIFRSIVKKGGSVFLGWGIGKNEKQEKSPPSEVLLEKLAKIRQSARFPGVQVIWLGNKHNKEVIIDDRIHLAGSFNWLSYRGDYAPRGEQVYMVREPKMVLEASKHLETVFINKLTHLVKSGGTKSDIASWLFGLSQLLGIRKFEKYIEQLDINERNLLTICRILVINKVNTTLFDKYFEMFIDSAAQNEQILIILGLLVKEDKSRFLKIVQTEKYIVKFKNLKILNENGQMDKSTMKQINL